MLLTVTIITYCFAPSQTTTVFAGLMRRRLALNHADKSPTQSENALAAASASETGCNRLGSRHDHETRQLY